MPCHKQLYSADNALCRALTTREPLPTIKKLIRTTSNLNLPGEYGTRAIHIAAMHNSEYLVRILLHAGANVNQKNNSGITALHFAVFHSCCYTAKILLRASANVHQVNNRGETALHCAAHCANQEMVRLLARAGADIDLLDQEKNSALMRAALGFPRTISNRVTKNRVKTIEELLDRGALVPTVPVSAREQGNIPVCLRLQLRRHWDTACAMIAKHSWRANVWAWQSEKYLRKKTDLPQALISLICSFATNANPIPPGTKRLKRLRAYLARAF